MRPPDASILAARTERVACKQLEYALVVLLTEFRTFNGSQLKALTIISLSLSPQPLSVLYPNSSGGGGRLQWAVGFTLKSLFPRDNCRGVNATTRHG
jgi:hypothetical protein